jgi:primosomal protein N' (replication factor Y)
MMAVIYQCPLVLGAATPSVSTYFAAREGQLEILRLSSRVLKTPLPHISAVDMRDEYAVGNRSLFSYPLLNLLKETAERGEKSIVFLNRRGYSTSLICRSCGYVFRCPRCDVALVYHKDRHQLKCHYCESVFPVPAVCPQCGKKDISYAGAGTQKAEEQLEEWLPGISYRRLDLDSVSRKNSGEKILSDFREGRFQILLGTQMVAKGHNIPGVQSVGILSVDNLLGMPTYLAAEQVFTLITQCAGRAGRYGKQGEVILQTFNPEHYAVETARHQDYEAFYSREIQFRRELFYPPFSRMMKISCFGTEYQAVSDHAEKLYRWLRIAAEHQKDFRMTPPYDEPIRKVRDRYYVSILIKAGSLTGLKSAMRESPLFHENGIIIDVDPI